ncbi:4-carboxymuconolactone decarboxylase [Crossiella equi]|uniref:4-carboxymuconolactone decarboxylase n=1 Tax=Crossiella equi TaxID=130796 RepID=A0ABS5A3P2_9PSEU|nr:carboxymuconolactone decarboxylase family protein [Crossiella equi]MBP2471196.1 4-carboxymuconolactone decarboxylase [Crossiella equi]
MGDYDQGLALLRQLGGSARPAVLDLFARAGVEDFGTEAVAYVYGGVYQRSGLGLAHRQLITVAALAALGYAQAQLDFHVAAARNLGCPPNELREALRLVARGEDTALGADGPGLDEVGRHLVLLAVHVAAGGVAPELRRHFTALAAAGQERAALEAILHLSAYVGFPAALNALTLVTA